MIDLLIQGVLQVYSALPLPLPVQTELLNFVDIIQSGGVIMMLLFVVGLILWTALGARLGVVGIGFLGQSHLRMRRLAKMESRQRRRVWGRLNRAGVDLMSAAERAHETSLAPRFTCEIVLRSYQDQLRRHVVLIKTLVVIAPLLGLLGTIIGMIETFEALETSAVFSQGSSISGGISKALFTTQMGLIVAIPGLLIGRILDRRERSLRSHLEQMSLLASAQQSSS